MSTYRSSSAIHGESAGSWLPGRNNSSFAESAPRANTGFEEAMHANQTPLTPWPGSEVPAAGKTARTDEEDALETVDGLAELLPRRSS